MTYHCKELDTLRFFTAKLNTALSELANPALLADLLVQHELVSKGAAGNIVSPSGIPNYSKVSQLVSIVYTYVQTVPSQEKATKVFNTFVLIVHDDLKLKDLAEQLVKHCSEDNPAYTSPVFTSAAQSGSATTSNSPNYDMKASPTIALLTCLKFNDKKVEIIKSVAANWKEFGVHFDFDDTGDQLEIFETQYAGKSPIEPCRAMFRHWLLGNGVEVTWEKLIEILIDNEKSDLASQLKGILKEKFESSN